MSMNLLEKIIRGLLKAFCAGPNAASEPGPPHGQQQHHGSQQPHHQQQGAHHPPPQQNHQQNHSHAQQYPPNNHQGLPPGLHQPSSPPHRPNQGRVDQNQINQHNEYYTGLRDRARKEGDAMARCFRESHEAFSHDGELAKRLSDEGKAHQREMERLNKEASQWIFVENNKDSKPGEVDLHGLFVKEAIAHTDDAIQAAQRRGDSTIHLIVGKGLHSQGHVAKLKPAVEELIQKHQLVAELDPHNSGVLIVHLQGRGGGTGRSIDPDEITRRLERNNEDCVIM